MDVLRSFRRTALVLGLLAASLPGNIVTRSPLIRRLRNFSRGSGPDTRRRRRSAGHRLMTLVGYATIAACSTARDRTFTSDRLSVATEGKEGAPDVILVHGVGGHADSWRAIADSVNGRYRLHLVQINGFGGVAARGNASGPVAAPVAEEIARYIRETKLAAPAVVGHSMGGSVALMLAARHPGSVGRIMMLDIPPFLGMAFTQGKPTTPTELRAMADGFRDSIMTRDTAPNLFERMVPTMTLNERARPTLVERARSSDRATVGNALHELMLADLRPELASITVPATVLYVVPPNVPGPAAGFDSLTAQSYVNLKGARLVRVDGSAHYIQLDRPDRVVQELDLLMRR